MQWRASGPTGRWQNRTWKAPSPPHGGPVDRTPQLRGRKVPVPCDGGEVPGRPLGAGRNLGAPISGAERGRVLPGGTRPVRYVMSATEDGGRPNALPIRKLGLPVPEVQVSGRNGHSAGVSGRRAPARSR